MGDCGRLSWGGKDLKPAGQKKKSHCLGGKGTPARKREDGGFFEQTRGGDRSI